MMLCPRCLTAIPGVSPGRDECGADCANCGAVFGPGLVLSEESVRELRSLPAWAWRRETPDSITVGIRNWPPSPLSILGTIAGIALLVLVLFALRARYPDPRVFYGMLALAVALSLFSLWHAAVGAFGGMRITLTRDLLTIFEGFGPVGQTWSIDPADVRSVRRAIHWHRGGRFPDSTTNLIEINGPPDISCADDFPDDRLAFVQAALWDLTVNRRNTSAATSDPPPPSRAAS